MMHDPLQHESCARLQAAIEKERSMAARTRQILLEQVAQLRTALNELAAQLEETIAGGENAASEMVDAFQAFRETVAEELRVFSAARARIESLEVAVAEKDQSLQDAERRRVELEREVADLQTACAAARDRAASLEEQATNLSRLLKTREERIVLIQSENAARLEAEENLRREMEALQSRLTDVDAARQAQAELKTALQEAHRENEQLRALTDSLGARLSEESAAKSALEAELAETRDKQAAIKASLEAELAAAQEQIATLNAKINETEQTREELGRLRAECEALQTKMEQAQAADAELETLRGELETLRGELHAAQERSAALEEELKAQSAKDNRLGLADQLADAVREAKEAQKTIRELRSELETLRGEAQIHSAAHPPSRPPAAARPRSAYKQSLGEILVNAGTLSMEQLEEALDEQRNNPTRHLGGILIEKGLVSEEAVAQALARQCDAEFIRLDQAPIEPDAPALISGRIAQQHTCIPVRVKDDTVLLAMMNPLDLVAIEDVERATNRRVEVAVATATEIRSAIARHYAENA